MRRAAAHAHSLAAVLRRAPAHAHSLATVLRRAPACAHSLATALRGAPARAHPLATARALALAVVALVGAVAGGGRAAWAAGDPGGGAGAGAGGSGGGGAADYDPASREWNGLAEMMLIAKTRGFEVEAVRELDWGDLSADDTLAVVYPARAATPSPADTLRFLAAGGRLLIADDFGGAEGLLRGLEMERGAPPDADAFYADDPALPWAHAVDPRHVLAAGGAAAILTNYPAYLRTALPPVFVFGGPDSDHAAVVEGKYGEGLFVALSDPSVLINAMLRHPANRAFLSNLLERVAGKYAVPEPEDAADGAGTGDAGLGAGAGAGAGAATVAHDEDAAHRDDAPAKRRIVLAWGAFDERGSFDAGRRAGGEDDVYGFWVVEGHIRSFGKWLATLAGHPLPALIVRLLAIIAVIVATAIALGVLPVGRRHYDGDWFGRGSAAPSRALAARRDLRAAARVLEEEVLATLLETVGADGRTWSALSPFPAAAAPERLADEILRRYGARLTAEAGDPKGTALPRPARDDARAQASERRRIARTLARLQRLSIASYDVSLRAPDPTPAEFLAVWKECRDLVERCGKGAGWSARPSPSSP
ncbi:MAG TPA: DUF4350 domain-containing protein [Myxococcota bacterium]|jgi:hypothetical protein|nr:DUF4350 domain-containing protein [Myxococcota bacterium]